MNGVVHDKNKVEPCRFYAVNRHCLYGENCQFSHGVSQDSPNSKLVLSNDSSDPTPSEAYGDDTKTMMSDGYYAPPIYNGVPELFTPFQPKTNGENVPMPHSGNGTHSAEESSDQQMAKQMVGLSIGQAVTQPKGRNVEASVFVPKGPSISGPNISGPPHMTHSTSTPSFQLSYAHMAAMGSHNALQASPLASPRMSPTASPLAIRRATARNNSPAPLSFDVPKAQNNLPISGAGDASNHIQHETVGGTTFFYSQSDMTDVMSTASVTFPNFTMYPGIQPHIAHMKPNSSMPSFFIPDEIKMEILNRQVLTLAQIDMTTNPDIPQEVDNYHNLFPLELPPSNPLHKSNTFGYPTTCYKAVNTKDGLSYCLRRIHDIGFRLGSTKCMGLIDLWKKIQHSNIVQLREVFTTKAFSDHSMVFVYDYHPCAETLLSRHLKNPGHQDNSYNNPYNVDGGARPYSAGKGGNNKSLHSEPLIWSYIVQLTSALRTIHQNGLACRVMDPTKVLITDKSRIRLNGLGIFDVLSFDPNQGDPMQLMAAYQQEDLVSLGKVILALSCNSLMGIQQEHIRTSLDIVARNYSVDLKNLILYLLSNQNQMRSLNDIMPMIGARFYTQLDTALMRTDALEENLNREIENGRLFRIMCKLGVINERPEFSLDTAWSETGDRYMLKLFRDYLFHQVDENGAPWIDVGHIVNCLNKLDAGVPEKVCLMSRDEQSILVVTYAELKQCIETSFNDIQQVASSAASVHPAGHF